MNRRASPQKGFTLVELATAMAISALVILGLGSALMGAGKIVQFMQTRDDAALEGSLVALERMKKEIQESPVYPLIPFEGDAVKVSFPQLARFRGNSALNSKFVLGQAQTVTLGSNAAFRKVSFYFDPSSKSVMREAPPEPPRPMVRNVEGVDFSYALSPLDDPSSFKWADRTPPKGGAESIRALGIRLRFERKPYGYTIPGLEKTFLLYRRHPLNAIGETERPA